MISAAAPRHRGLDGGALDPRALVPGGVEQPRVLVHEQSELLDGDARFGDVTSYDAVLGQSRSERGPRQGPARHRLERARTHPDRAHAVVHAARTQAALRDDEARAGRPEQVRCRCFPRSRD
jgi:hypothetical protein